MRETTTVLPELDATLAPPLLVEAWLNTQEDISLESLRGRVVVVHAFQMLCPGCVSHGLPQAQRIQAEFSAEEVCVLGLHSVFEHHDAMKRESLEAFLYEYRITFPVGIDRQSRHRAIPKTMASYEMHGTPTLLLIDRRGRLRLHAFGRPSDMAVGAAVAQLVAEGIRSEFERSDESVVEPSVNGCSDQGCEISSYQTNRR